MTAKRRSGKTQPEHLRNRAKPAVALRLDRDQIARVDELAAARGVTRSRVLADAIAAALDATVPTPDHSRSSTTAA